MVCHSFHFHWFWRAIPDYQSEPCSRLGGAGVVGLFAGGCCRTAGCCRGCVGASAGGGVTSAGGLACSTGVLGLDGVGPAAAGGLLASAGFCGGSGSNGCLSVGLIVWTSLGADVAGGDATGAVFLAGPSEPLKKYQPAAATTNKIPATANQVPPDDFFAAGGGCCCG